MVRYAPLFCALIFNLCTASATSMIKRIVGGGDRVPGNAEIQNASRDCRIRQGITVGDMQVCGIEIYAARYPRSDQVDLKLSCMHDGVILRAVHGDVPPDHHRPLRITFEPVTGYDALEFEMYPEHTNFGQGVRILFFPKNHYTGGRLSIGGKIVEGDLLFRILTPNPARITHVPGLDLFSITGRFPSPTLPPGNRLIQEFAAPRDSLSFIECIVGTGGKIPGPLLRWSVETQSEVVGRGYVPVQHDNETIRFTFPTIEESRGLPLKLVLEIAGSWDGDLRFWLCNRVPGMGGLSVADRLLETSLVLRTFHTSVTDDSMEVAISAFHPPQPIPSNPVAGSCRLIQEFMWDSPRSRHDYIGMRLAVGGGLTSGTLSYLIEEVTHGVVINSGDMTLAGLGSNDFIWFPLGDLHGEGALRLTLFAPDVRSENGARFWWSPFDILEKAQAYGCVPSPQGDCIFKLAVGYSPREWLCTVPSIFRRASAGEHKSILIWLMVARTFILTIMIILALVLLLKHGLRSGDRRGYE